MEKLAVELRTGVLWTGGDTRPALSRRDHQQRWFSGGPDPLNRRDQPRRRLVRTATGP